MLSTLPAGSRERSGFFVCSNGSVPAVSDYFARRRAILPPWVRFFQRGFEHEKAVAGDVRRRTVRVQRYHGQGIQFERRKPVSNSRSAVELYPHHRQQPRHDLRPEHAAADQYGDRAACLHFTQPGGAGYPVQISGRGNLGIGQRPPAERRPVVVSLPDKALPLSAGLSIYTVPVRHQGDILAPHLLGYLGSDGCMASPG